jgi:hypothetical protein
MRGKPFPELKIVAHFRTGKINTGVTAGTEACAGAHTRGRRAIHGQRMVRYSSKRFDQRGR